MVFNIIFLFFNDVEKVWKFKGCDFKSMFGWVVLFYEVGM